MLAVCYFNGIGVDKDVKEAVRLLRSAAENNVTHAQASYQSEDDLKVHYSQYATSPLHCLSFVHIFCPS